MALQRIHLKTNKTRLEFKPSDNAKAYEYKRNSKNTRTKEKRVFTNEQIKRARLNGISYSRLWERVKM